MLRPRSFLLREHLFAYDLHTMGASHDGVESTKNAKDAERRRLFALYAKNLEVFRPECAGHFACPICGQGFNEDALNAPVAVDLAHIYPASCGGKYATLTCATFNNRLGSNFDHHVAMDHKLYDALSGKGTGSIDGRIVTEVGDMGVTVSVRGSHVQFEHIEKQTKPGTGQAMRDFWMAQNKVECTFSGPRFDPKRHAVSTLASGFLAAFAYIGYEYCFCADTKWIREVLQRDEPAEDQRIITLAARRDAITFHSATLRDPLYSVGVALVKDMDIKVIGVALPAADQDLAMNMVILPGFGEEGKGHFEALWNHKPAHIEVKYDTVMGAIEKRLVDPKFRWAGRDHYAYTFSQQYLEDREKDAS
jgi:hypothetical protein